jgi:hypothetical protein
MPITSDHRLGATERIEDSFLDAFGDGDEERIYHALLIHQDSILTALFAVSKDDVRRIMRDAIRCAERNHEVATAVMIHTANARESNICALAQA